VESAVFFDELIRTGGDKQMTNPSRASSFRTSRLIPAVEYLQSQRARAMMMAKLAEATAEVDVYLVPANGGGGGGGRGGGGRGRGAPAAAGATGDAEAVPARGNTAAGRGGGAGNGGRQSATQRHFNMANLAGYPAISVPHGFQDSGSPTALTIYGQPFKETEILALAKAYQDASGVHLKHPNLDGAAPGAKVTGD
jgi:Asp-tRNA(Asn)/Glu-tRNA(Gln) amidotransferase A subunit family amidase